MVRADLGACALAVVLIGAATYAGSQFRPQPAPSGAVAAALENHLAASVGLKPEEWRGAGIENLQTCLDSKVLIDVPAIRDKLTYSVLDPIPAAACSSETIEGDFGMFTSRTDYFFPDGTQAGYLRIGDVRCAASIDCEIDIDDYGFGNSYRMVFGSDGWKVVEVKQRWIV